MRTWTWATPRPARSRVPANEGREPLSPRTSAVLTRDLGSTSKKVRTAARLRRSGDAWRGCGAVTCELPSDSKKSD
jgi:hypothetical protein